MWLLNIETRRLECFDGHEIPYYAILSHRWEGNEISFQDVISGRARNRESYAKINGFCEQVRSDDPDIGYVWVDTCCIDKSNNSELSEAINSMYKWYRQAKVCYAFLADVSISDLSGFEKSVWFTRGWTLQELLAPDNVQFFDKIWGKLGTKLELGESIEKITGIPPDALKHFDPRRSRHSVADRMSWAAPRQTARKEDLAYSLLGLFGVNMPLLYGEGSKAFLRLQEEILKISDDLTIFAWSKFPSFAISNDYLRDTDNHDFGVFAASPGSFMHKGRKFRNLLETSQINEGNILETFFSGAGLAINLVLVPYCPEIYIAPLCDVSESTKYVGAETREIVAMFLERTEYRGRYRRVAYNGCCIIIGHADNLNLSTGRTQRVVLERTPYHAMGRQRRERYGFNILHIENDILRLFQVSEKDNVDIMKRNPVPGPLFMEPGDIGVAGIIRLSRKQLPPIYFHFGFDFDFNPFCLISRPLMKDNKTSEHMIVFGKAAEQTFSVECNVSILSLVHILQSDSRKFNLQQDNIELHVGSWKATEIQFVGRDCRIGLDASAGHVQGYVYHTHIGLAHKDYPWATGKTSQQWDNAPRRRFQWHSHRWQDR